jgi:PAS domain-containing protein
MVDEPRDRLLVRLGGSAPIGLAAFDAKLRYTAINDWLAQLNGASVEQHIGRTLREMVPMLADQLEPVMRAIFDGGEPVYGIPVTGRKRTHRRDPLDRSQLLRPRRPNRPEDGARVRRSSTRPTASARWRASRCSRTRSRA